MSAEEDHAGTSQVVLERFVERQLPVLMEIKTRADAGERLSEGDLEIMSRLIERAHNFNAAAQQFPELKSLIARIIDLYEEITEQALANEQEDKGTK